MQQINLTEYTEVLKEHKKQIVIVFLCIFIPIFFISFEIVSTYKSEATLFIEKVPLKTEEIIFRRGSSRIDITKEIIRLRSFDFTQSVVRSLPEKIFFQLYNELSLKERIMQRIKKILGTKAYNSLKKIFGRPAVEYKNDQEIEKSVLQKLPDIRSIKYRGDGVLTISATTQDPEISYQIVNAYATLWQSMNLQENKEDVISARKFIEEELETSSQKLNTSEDNYLKYKIYIGVPTYYNYQEEWEIESVDPELARLSSEVKSCRANYNAWYNKLREIQIWERLVKSDIQVIDVPQIPDKPTGSSKMRTRLMGFIFALFVAIGLPIMVDFLKDYVKKPIDIERLLSVPVVGVIPNMGK
ncbi:MAG: hypothetical protein RAP70_10575 [Candidatus Celaenobacter antarcticus]|nr:hypothetical protein [Candidatus Celaenobacter antarcticus]